jgi:hypothetical protein
MAENELGGGMAFLQAAFDRKGYAAEILHLVHWLAFLNI